MKEAPNRRNFIQRSLAIAGGLFTIPLFYRARNVSNSMTEAEINAVKSVKPLGYQWETSDPFLFCVHHEDFFPEGNAQMVPDNRHFQGRHMADDFIVKDGLRMYPGKPVPGFPGQPTAGLETIPGVRTGQGDPAHSLGITGLVG